jgi:hypothetical protein
MAPLRSTWKSSGEKQLLLLTLDLVCHWFLISLPYFCRHFAPALFEVPRTLLALVNGPKAAKLSLPSLPSFLQDHVLGGHELLWAEA